MAITRVGQRVQTGNKTAGASLVSGVSSAAIAIGALVIVACSADNTATVDGASNTHTSVTDTKGNTYTKLGEQTNTVGGAAGDGVTVSLWFSVLTVALTTTDTWTLNLTSTTAKNIVTEEWTIGAGNTLQHATGSPGRGTADASLNGPSITVSGLSAITRLWLMLDGQEAPSTDVFTRDTDVNTGCLTRGTTGSTAATNITQTGSFAIDASTSKTVQSADATAACDWASLLCVLEEVSAAPSNPGKRLLAMGVG